MDFRSLEIFVAVARQGGFSRAARQLNSTQPTISKAIQQLEHDCGSQLIERLPRSIRLTTAGEVLLRRAAAMLAEQSYLHTELADLRGLKVGKLKLGLPALGSSALFAPFFATFRKRYPGIEIELHEHGSKRLEESVRSSEIELGATLYPVAADFAWQPVCDEPIQALLTLDNPLAGARAVKLAQLADQPMILFERGFALNAIISAAYRRRRLVLKEAARSGHADFIIALASAGLGVALLPRLVVASRGPLSVKAVLVDESDLRWKLGFIWRKGATLSPAAQHWLALVAGDLEESKKTRREP